MRCNYSACMLYSRGSVHKVPFSDLFLPFLVHTSSFLVSAVSLFSSLCLSVLLALHFCCTYNCFIVFSALRPQIPAFPQVEIGSALLPNLGSLAMRSTPINLTFFCYCLMPGLVDSIRLKTSLYFRHLIQYLALCASFCPGTWDMLRG